MLDTANNVIRLVFVILLAGALAGCSGGPGAPLVRTGNQDGQGPLIAGCQNISREDRTINFITDYYLTTWASASREGEAAGKYYGLQRGLADIGAVVDDEYIREFAFGGLPESASFCKAFIASPEAIHSRLSMLVQRLGYLPISYPGVDDLIATDYVYRVPRQSSTGSPPHRWKDRFLFRLQAVGNGRTAIIVTRDVSISRRHQGVWSPYIRAQSVGHNEAVILNLLAEELAHAP
jgi:hypothetical protein